MYAGDGFLQIIGYGSVPVQPTLPPEAEPIILQDVALIRKMACNLVSLRQLRREGIYWDMKQQRRGTYLRDKYDEVICELEDKHGQFVIKDLPRGLHSAALTVHRHRIHSATSRSRSGGTANLWHLRLGHSGPEAVAHLTKHTEGVRIRGPTTVQCDACGIAKVKQRIRRAHREGTHKAAQRWAFDIVPFEGDSEGFRKILLIVDQDSGLARGYFIKDAQTGTLKPLLQRILGEIERQDNSYPEVLECDNEIMKHTSIVNMLIAPPYSLRIEPSAPDTQAQNGGVERIVGVIKQKLVAMRASAKFPAYLIRYIYAAAIY